MTSRLGGMPVALEYGQPPCGLSRVGSTEAEESRYSPICLREAKYATIVRSAGPSLSNLTLPFPTLLALLFCLIVLASCCTFASDADATASNTALAAYDIDSATSNADSAPADGDSATSDADPTALRIF